MHHVAVGDDVFLAFQTQFSAVAGAGFAAERNVVGIGDGLGANESFFKIGVNDASGRRGPWCRDGWSRRALLSAPP